MAYSDKEKELIFKIVFSEIENGRAVRNVLKDEGMPDSVTFFKWLDNDADKIIQYTRACEVRADAIFEDILSIADDSSGDKKYTENGEVMDGEYVARSRLRVDARKWIVSKLNPKKYGDKIDMTTDGEKITVTPIFGSNPLDGK